MDASFSHSASRLHHERSTMTDGQRAALFVIAELGDVVHGNIAVVGVLVLFLEERYSSLSVTSCETHACKRCLVQC